MASLLDLFVKITADPSEYKKGVKEAREATEQFAGFAEAAGVRIATSLSLAGIGIAAIKGAEEFEKAGFKIQRSTGATGDKLKSLEDSLSNVYQNTGKSAEEVAELLSQLNIRTGLTGEALESLASSSLRFAKVTGSDLQSSVKANERLFQQWSISTEDQSKALDVLYVATTKSAKSATDLTASMAVMGPALRAFGYSFTEATALVASFERAGLEAADMTRGLNTAFIKLKDEGKNPREEFAKLIAALGDTSTAAEATTRLIDLGFTKRAILPMADAIQHGVLNIKDLTKTLEGSEGAVNKAAKNTESLSDKWNKLLHTFNVELAPAGKPVLEFLSVLVEGVGAATKAFTELAKAAAHGLPEPKPAQNLEEFDRITKLTGMDPKIAAQLRAKFIADHPVAPRTDTTSTRTDGSAGAAGGLSNDAYNIRATEIDAEAAHQKALLDIKRMGFEQQEKLRLISAAQNIANLKKINEEELAITLNAINQKLALQREKGDGKKDATLLAQRQAAEDKAATESIKLEQRVAAEKERIFDQTVSDHVKKINAENQVLYDLRETVDDNIGKHWKSSLDQQESWYAQFTQYLHNQDLKREDDRLKAYSMQVASQARSATAELELKRQQVDFLERRGQITPEQRIAMEASINEQEYEQQRQATQDQIDLLDLRHSGDVDYATKKQELEDRLTQLNDNRRVHELRAEQELQAYRMRMAVELSNEFRGAFESMERDAARSIVEWKGKWADPLKNLAKDVATSMLQSFLKGLFKPLEDAAAKAGRSIGGALSSIWSKGNGGGGGVPGIGNLPVSNPNIPGVTIPGLPSAGGAGGGAGGASGSVVSGGVMGTIGAVGAAVGAVSSIIGNFQMAGMNKTLDLIEHSTRYSQIYLNEIKTGQGALPADAWKLHEQILAKFDSVIGALGNGGGGGKGGTNYITIQANSIPDLVTELKRLGVVPA